MMRSGYIMPNHAFILQSSKWVHFWVQIFLEILELVRRCDNQKHPKGGMCWRSLGPSELNMIRRVSKVDWKPCKYGSKLESC